jgi:protein kinase X
MTQDPGMIYFFLDYIPGGELFTLLRNNIQFPLEQAKFYCAHIIKVFDYLHSKDIIYRDLKPENILINLNGYLKITDFGFAKKVDGKTYTLCGTPEYMAPEIILNRGHSKPVDWWTLGILTYEMLIGIDPFNDEDPMIVYQNIVRGKMKFPRNMDPDAKSFIKHLLVGDTSMRIGCLKNGIRDIYEHKFFKNFDWDLLIEMKMQPYYIPKIK